LVVSFALWLTGFEGRDATKMNKHAELLNKVISPTNHRCLAIKAQVKAFPPVGST
jgi:hypothetical protein